MSNKPVLVVLAAGMGSRYGGLKQIDPVGSHGEAILDYSIYDAYEAGFRTAVILIKEAIREDFMATVGKRLSRSPMEIRYAYQELEKLPEQQDGSQRPSLILRRAGEEGLWELAKKTGSTVAAIRSANKLQEEPKPGQLLLIPVC